MTRLLDQWLSGFFILIFGVITVVGLLLPGLEHEVLENRRLEKLPGIPRTVVDWQEWPQKFDSYYQDHFGFRYPLLSSYRHLKYYLQDSPIPSVFYGSRPNWLFYDSIRDGSSLDDYRNVSQYTASQLEGSVKRIVNTARWLRRQGIAYIFVLAPSKQYIYPQILPEHIRRLPRANVVGQLLDALAAHPEVQVLDLRPVLQRRARERLLYYQADTHWNHYGANIAQYALAQRLQVLFPDRLVPYLYAEKEFTDSAEYFGDLSLFMGIPEYFTEFEVKPNFPTCSNRYSPVQPVYGETFSTHCVADGLQAVIYRDSFFTAMQPFVSTYLGNATYINGRLKRRDAIETLEKLHPDVVIEEWIDRVLPR